MSTDRLPLSLPVSLGEAISSRRQARAARRRRLPLRILLMLADVLPVWIASVALGVAPLLALATAVLAAAMLTPVRDQARLNPTLGPELPSITGRVATASVLVSLAAGQDLTATGTLLSIPAAVAGVALARTAARAIVRIARRRGAGLEPTLIVGSGPVGVQVADTLTQRPEFGLTPIGFLDDRPAVDTDLAHLGPARDLASIVLAHDVRRVVLAYGSARESEMVSVLRDCGALPFDVHFHALPRFFELGTAGDRRTDDVWGFPLVKLTHGSRSRAWATKRLFDRTVASLVLLAASPVMIALALAVRLSSPGPILFRQERIGQWGRPFQVLKFRSMRENDDSDTQWTVDDDDRVTWVGRIMRPTHLDELPQLFNVLRGEMSIVGPRPERPVFVDLFNVEIPRYEDRHRVPVGLTGWAQVNGLWGDTSIEDRARFDNRYIEDWSIWRDLGIILKTIPTLLGRKDEVATSGGQDGRSEGSTPSERSGAEVSTDVA